MSPTASQSIDQLREVMNVTYISAALTSTVIISIIVAASFGVVLTVLYAIRKMKMRRFNKVVNEHGASNVAVISFDKNGTPILVGIKSNTKGRREAEIEDIVEI